MTKAEQKITASYSWEDEPLDIDEVDGLAETVQEVAETKEKTLVRCEERVPDYDVYWNEKTDTVRIAAVVMGCSWEVPKEEL